VNKSKKIIKDTGKPKKKHIKINPMIWVAAAAVLGLALIAALLIDQLYKRPLVVVDGEKYYLEDMKYHIYTIEANYDYIDQLYGGTYWDSANYNYPSMSNREYAKLEAINNFVYELILYKEAVANGYTLTEEESEKVEENVNSFINDLGLSEKFLKENGFTPEFLRDVFTRNTLATRFKQDVIDSLDIDDEAIKAEFKYEDYRQYDIEYLFISTAPTETDDEESDDNKANEVKKQTALEKITSYREKALETEDWSKLVPEDEKELIYRSSYFLPTDIYYPENLMEVMLEMENGEISDVIETESGYYVVRMVNNNSSATYDSKVEAAITEKEEEEFAKEYESNIYPKYTVDLKEKAIRNLRLGRITLVD